MSGLPDDLLWRQLRGVPAFRALLRAVESRFYQDLELARPLLDLGCGDGRVNVWMSYLAQVSIGVELDEWTLEEHTGLSGALKAELIVM